MRCFGMIARRRMILVPLAMLACIAMEGRAAAAEKHPLWEACRAALDINSAMTVEKLTDAIDSGRLRGAALAAAYENRGCIAESQARDADALADYSKVIVLEPNDAEAYFLRGRTYGNGFHYAQAIAGYDAALGLAPDDAETYYRRGHAHEEGRHDHAAAISDYTASLRLDPDNPAVYHMRAIALDNAGRKAEAAADRAAEKKLVAALPASVRFAKRQAGEWE